MCIAIPARIVELRGANALVERYGERLEVSLLLLDESAAVGDYLIVQARTFAVRKIDPDEALEAYRLFDEIIEALPSG
jgi:hydrogenase expression/formation protein HypC